jgi:predicted methyltransferase
MQVSGLMLNPKSMQIRKDTADHPNGVWNLLPSLRGVKMMIRQNIISIGESDRMTLRFIKE